jgi:hypothetical protein
LGTVFLAHLRTCSSAFQFAFLHSASLTMGTVA